LGIAAAEPLYVISIDPAGQRIIVGNDDDLKTRTLIARNLNWIGSSTPAGPVRVTAKIRSRAAEAWATVTPMPDGRAHVEFDEPQRAVAPGQAVVFYESDRVLGGGWIDRNQQ
jgi:tRNA-specific 2-thiouridylase